MPGQEEFLLPREVAGIIRVTTRTLQNWEQKGALVPVRLPSGRKRYRRDEAEALLRARAREKARWTQQHQWPGERGVLLWWAAESWPFPSRGRR
ncbi:MAG: MerR family transcriptional regulator [Firmicutes bacterium]|nr:MerR family transcriptional regulator [Bacillota bacterium]